MKSFLELDQFDLESASQQQVADLIQALLEQVKTDAVLLQSKQAEIESKDDKIQALTTGVGKSWIACVLAQKVCRDG